MKDCPLCNELRSRLLAKMKRDPTIGLQEWFYAWLKRLDNIEFMKEFFTNKSIHQRVAYDLKFEIKGHIENIHNITLKE